MKKTNKGFSLVELIIVIAIMAILAGAIAPALIRYIDKSRRSNDVTSCKAIKTAVDAAMGSEDVYILLTTNGADIVITPGKPTGAETSSTSTSGNDAIKIDYQKIGDNWDGTLTETEAYKLAQDEIAKSLGEKTPKIKYKKNAESPKASEHKACKYLVNVNKGGTVTIAISGGPDKIFSATTKGEDGTETTTTSDKAVQYVWTILPETCQYYQ